MNVNINHDLNRLENLAVVFPLILENILIHCDSEDLLQVCKSSELLKKFIFSNKNLRKIIRLSREVKESENSVKFLSSDIGEKELKVQRNFKDNRELSKVRAKKRKYSEMIFNHEAKTYEDDVHYEKRLKYWEDREFSVLAEIENKNLNLNFTIAFYKDSLKQEEREYEEISQYYEKFINNLRKNFRV